MEFLARSKDFLEAYLYQVGTTEVPVQFHFWAAMSLLAGSVSDRVWVEPDPGRRIYPNLYVFLIGPSGSGKEQAVMGAAKLGLHEPLLDLFMGRATRQYLLDYLSRNALVENGVRIAANPHLYLITEELGSAIRAGDLGHDLVSFMTEYYTRKPIGNDGTRATGLITLLEPCFNWIAGSTDEWLIRAVDRDAIEGGFFARVISVRGRRNYTARCPSMQYPDDRADVIQHLKERVSGYARLKGSFHYTAEAKALHDAWYLARVEPQEALEEPAFNRADEMVYRLSLLIRLAQMDVTDDSLVHGHTIGATHFQEALTLWDSLAAELPNTLRKASATERTASVDWVEETLKRNKAMDHSTLLKRASNRGMDRDLLRSAIETLKEREVIHEEIIVQTGGRPRKVYRWKSL